MSNPYQSPNEFADPKASSYGGNSPMQPLVGVAWWLQLIGWFNIVFGVLYCLTIIGLVIGWLPVWMGFLLKSAGDKLKQGEMHHHSAANDLATVTVVVGVMVIINIVIMVLYLLAMLGMLVLGLAMAGAAASS